MNTDGPEAFSTSVTYMCLLGASSWWSLAETGGARKASRESVLIIQHPRPRQSQLQFAALRAKAVYKTPVYYAPLIKSQAIKIGIRFS